jgi:hypothetical protein
MICRGLLAAAVGKCLAILYNEGSNMGRKSSHVKASVPREVLSSVLGQVRACYSFLTTGALRHLSTDHIVQLSSTCRLRSTVTSMMCLLLY